MNLIEEIKQNDQLVDNAIRQLYGHESRLVNWSHLAAYPQLHAKLGRQIPGDPPCFTSEEKQERERLIEQLDSAKSAMILHELEAIRREEQGQPLEETFPSDSVNDLYNGLYLLARCGDDSAFLELTASDWTFPQNWFFQSSLVAWREQADSGPWTKNILKKVSEAIVLPYQRPKSGRPKERSGAYMQHVAQKTSVPDKPNSEIYRSIAKENLEADEKEVTREAKEKEAGRIKKELQRHTIPFPADEMVELMLTGEMTPKAIKHLEESRWNWLFRHLREIF